MAITCNDANPCTVDTCAPATGCAHADVGRVHGDACCHAGDFYAVDHDCPAECGNGLCEPGETQVSCLADCPLLELVFENCGDGTFAGVGLKHSACFVRRKLNGAGYAPATPLTLVFAADAGRVAAASVTVPAGWDYAYFSLEGLSTGVDTLTVSGSDATGSYQPDAMPVTVESSRFAFVDLRSPRYLSDGRDEFYLVPEIPSLAGLVTATTSAALTVDLSLAPGSTPGIAQLENAGDFPLGPVFLPEGSSGSAWLYVSEPALVGTYAVRAEASGFATSDSADVTVLLPAPNLVFENCGAGYVTGTGLRHSACYVRRMQNGANYAPPTPVTLHFASLTGRAAIPDAVIAAGYDYAYVELRGVSAGADTLTVTASDANGAYQPGDLPVTVETPYFAYAGIETTRNTLSLPDDFYLQPLLPTTGWSLGLHAVADVEIALSLAPGSTPGIVGVEDGLGAPLATATLAAGSSTTGWLYVSEPASLGSYTVRASAPGFSVSDSEPVVVEAPAPQLVFENCGAGARTGVGLYHSNCYVRRTLNGANFAPPTALDLHFASAAGHASVPDVTIPAGYDYAYFPLRGVSAGVDTLTVTGTDGDGAYSPGDLPVTVETPYFAYQGVQTTRNTQSLPDDVYLQPLLPTTGWSLGLYAVADLEITFSLAPGSTPGIVVVQDALGAPMPTATIPAGAYSTDWLYVSEPAGLGSYALRATATGFAVSDSELVVVEAPAPQLVFENCGTGTFTGVGLYHAGCYVRRTLNGANHAPPTELALHFESASGHAAIPDVTIAASTDYAYFSLQGVSPGPDTLTVTGSDLDGTYFPGALPVTVETPYFAYQDVQTPRNPMSLPDAVYLQPLLPTTGWSLGLYAIADLPVTLSLAPGSTPGIVEVQDAGGSPLATTTIPAGSYYTGWLYVSTPTGLGTYRLRAEAPGFSVSDSEPVVVEASAPRLVFENCGGGYYAGVGLQHQACYVRRTLNGLNHAPATEVVLHFTTSTGRAAAPDVTIPANGDYAYVWLQGVSPGLDTLTVSDPGGVYASDSMDALVEAPYAAYVSLDTARTPASGLDDFYVQPLLPTTGWGLGLYAINDVVLTMALAPGSTPGIAFVADAGGLPAPTVTIVAGDYWSGWRYVSPPAGAGTYRVRTTATGFLASDSDLVTVTP